MPGFALLAVAFAWPARATATTWIEHVESVLTCTSLADPSERAELLAPFIQNARSRETVQAYFEGPARDSRHARLRHLTMLAAIGWWANLVNDQHLRGDVYAVIQHFASAYAAERPEDPLFRQISRCARAQILSAMLEVDEVEAAESVAAALALDYGDAPPALSVEDWPMLLALRELALEPRAEGGIAVLTHHAHALASRDRMAAEPLRASRLFAAVACGSLATHELDNARDLAMYSMVITGKPPAPAAAWRAFPVLYDVFVKTKGPEEAAGLRALLGEPIEEPAALLDRAAAFDALERASRAAGTSGDYAWGGRLQLAALEKLNNGLSSQSLSQAFYGYGLQRLSEARDVEWEILARNDPAWGARTVATYLDSYDTLLRQSQDQFVANAGEQRFFHDKIDRSLEALTALYPAVPPSKTQIEDTTFRLAQLRSFGRLTLATVAAELGRVPLDADKRFQVERFFSLSTQTSTWLQALFSSVRTVDPARPEQAKALWDAFSMLDVFHQETAREHSSYADLVRRQVPSVADSVTPRPLPVTAYEHLLMPDEALVATLVTPRALYVWAVTPRGVSLARVLVTEREVTDLVRRLRASLTPAARGGKVAVPPFDAAAAHEIYRLVFEPVAASLADAKHVLWYGHGPLGSVPPSVLVVESPPKPFLSEAVEFGRTRFLLDRFAFSVLADLSLFPVHRGAPRGQAHERAFLGVGAPMLNASQLTAGPRSKSYELAGGLDGKALMELPLLTESMDELRGIAGAFGESNSTLWLGPEASEKRFVGTALRGYQVVALATHGFLAHEVRNVMGPSLMLALALDSKDRFDGLLTAREIAALQIDADLVVLSACNTAAADGRPRSETFTGLTQAFFTAGARSLMVSHWPVMSGAAVQLSVATLEGSRSKGLSLAASLQLAMQAARRSGTSSPIESHPSYWGPFVVVGDGRRGLAR